MRIIRLLVLSLTATIACAPAVRADDITCGAYTEAAEAIASNRGGIPEALIPMSGRGGSHIEGMGLKQYHDLSVLYRNLIEKSPFLSDWFAPLVAAMCIRKGEMGNAFDEIGMVIKECDDVRSRNPFLARMNCLSKGGIVTSSEVRDLVAEKSSSIIPPSRKR
ncbi:MAG: hypothetical protein ACYCZR_15320 [Burkholderiales bacterium]